MHPVRGFTSFNDLEISSGNHLNCKNLEHKLLLLLKSPALQVAKFLSELLRCMWKVGGTEKDIVYHW